MGINQPEYKSMGFLGSSAYTIFSPSILYRIVQELIFKLQAVSK